VASDGGQKAVQLEFQRTLNSSRKGGGKVGGGGEWGISKFSREGTGRSLQGQSVTMGRLHVLSSKKKKYSY